MQVLVSHSVKYNRNNDAIGTEFNKHSRRVIPASYIYRHRINGCTTVRLESGDIFPVIPYDGVFNGKQYTHKTVTE